MRFTELGVQGAFLVEPEPHSDERGIFARTWDAEEFAAHGLPARFDQCSTSYNERAGTLRGMHLQLEPHGETKLVRCTRGRVQDMVLDLRESSPTFGLSHSVVLTADNRAALLVPPGCAHGFLTLEPAAEICYSIEGPYAPESADGVRWDDPAFAMAWYGAPTVISDRDASYPLRPGRPRG
jgi:dTDP-4-dehydrorhamnose 3,5-epimerase